MMKKTVTIALLALSLATPSLAAPEAIVAQGSAVWEGSTSRWKSMWVDAANAPITPTSVSAEVVDIRTGTVIGTWNTDAPPTSSVVYIPLSSLTNRILSTTAGPERHRIIVTAIILGEPVKAVGEFDVSNIPGRVVDGFGALVTPTPNTTPTVTVPPYGGGK